MAIKRKKTVMKKKKSAPSKKSGISHAQPARKGVIPLGDRILIEEIKKEESEKRVAGIIIPATVKEDRETKRGRVVAVGEGKVVDGTRVPVEVMRGDTVLFQWGDQLVIDDKEYYIVSESSILAVIR